MTEVLFRIIHISDLHYCVQANRRSAVTAFRRNSASFLDTCVAQVRSHGLASLALLSPDSYIDEVSAGVALFAYQWGESADAIVVTGDIATSGIVTDVQKADSMLSAPASDGYFAAAGHETLAAAGVSLYVIPGNHDKYRDQWGNPGCQNFGLVLGKYMRNFDGHVCHWIRRKQGQRLVLIGADFSLRQRKDARGSISAVYGQGRVYEDVLASLRTRTRQLRQRFAEVEIIWIIHFAPFECGPDLELLNRLHVLDAAADLRVKTILCGHTHETAKFQQRDVTVYCAGSAACIDSKGRNEVHVIDFLVGAERAVRRETFRWASTQDEFRPRKVD